MKTVLITAEPVEGYNTFCRGGHYWTREGRVVKVSDELLKLLKHSKRIHVDEDVDGLEGEIEPLELISHTKDGANPVVLAQTEHRMLKRELERLDMESKNAELRAKIEAKKAEMSKPAVKSQEKSK